MDFLGVVGGGPGYTDVVGADGRQYTVRGTFGFRNNNPGNIRDSDFARRHGAIGASGGFAVFPSYEAGRAAKAALMFGPSYSGMTIRQAITKYAPPNENNTGAYINVVSRALGVSPDTNVDDLSEDQRTAMLDAMQSHEGYRVGSVTNEFGERVDPGIMSAMFDAPTPEAAPRWETAVPGAVERAELADVPSGLLGPSVTPSQGYGQLAATMGETPSRNLAGAMTSGELAAPAGGLLNPAVSEDRFASAAPVAQGLDSLRGGLLASNTAMGAPDPARFADAQVAQGMDGLRSGLLSYAENAAPAPAQTAIETASPTAPAAAPSVADAYGQLAQSLDQANVLGLSGQKLYDPNAPMGELQQTGLLSSLPTQQPAPQTVQQQPAQEMGDYQDQQVSVSGPASPTIETQQGPTPPAEVGSFPSAPQTTGQKAKSIAGRVAGSLLGSAALGPVGGLLGGMLGNEIASGKGLFSGQGPQSIGGLLSSLGASVNNIGQGAQQSYSVWGGGTPIGTQATATDGSRITSLGGGLLARTDANGVTTTFNDRGNIVGSPVSTGGLLAGIGRDFGSIFGGGSSSGGAGGIDTSGMSPGLW